MFTLPSDPTQRQKIKDAVKQASDAKLQIESHKQHIKDIAANIKEEIGMPPAFFNQLVTIYHNQDADEKQAKSDELFETYDVLFK